MFQWTARLALSSCYHQHIHLMNLTPSANLSPICYKVLTPLCYFKVSLRALEQNSAFL